MDWIGLLIPIKLVVFGLFIWWVWNGGLLFWSSQAPAAAAAWIMHPQLPLGPGPRASQFRVKLSTRNVNGGLRWTTFDDIIRTLVRVAKLIVKARVNRLVMILKRGKNPLSNTRQDKRSYSALASKLRVIQQSHMIPKGWSSNTGKGDGNGV